MDPIFRKNYLHNYKQFIIPYMIFIKKYSMDENFIHFAEKDGAVLEK